MRPGKEEGELLVESEDEEEEESEEGVGKLGLVKKKSSRSIKSPRKGGMSPRKGNYCGRRRKSLY